MDLISRLRDLLRGFDEADARSLANKLERGKSLPAGSVIEITNREHKAMKHFLPRSHGKTEAG